ncbi:MAG: hypothetical protein ABEJ92_05660 [Halobacteriales archaeon]
MDETDESEVNGLDSPMQTIAGHDVSRRKLMVASAAGAGVASLSGCISGLGGGGSSGDQTGTAEEETPNYVVTSHVYVTHDVGNFKHSHFAASCAPQYQFVPGQLIGFRVGLWDPETGKQLTDEDVQSVTISFEGPSDVKDLKLEWNGDDKEHAAQQWSARLRNTSDLKPGQYKYTVHVTDDDANYQYVGIWENTFTILKPSKAPPTVTPTPSGG